MGGYLLKKMIKRLIVVTLVLTLFCATTSFAQVYVDPTSGIVSAQITKQSETMTVNGVPSGIPYALENNTDIALTVVVNGVVTDAIAPRMVIEDAEYNYYKLDCVYVNHPLGTTDMIVVKNGIVNITQK